MPSLILNKLWIGDIHDSKNNEATMVVNCTKYLPSYIDNTIRLPINDPGYGCNVNDVDQQIFIKLSLPILKKIKEEIDSGGRVLVHCYAGIQRSAALVLLYIIIYGEWRVNPNLSLKEINLKKFNYAKKYMKSRRPIVFKGGINMECAIRKILDI